MLDFIELGLNIKHKIKIYISSTHKKQTTMHSERQTKPLILFNECYEPMTRIRDYLNEASINRRNGSMM